MKQFKRIAALFMCAVAALSSVTAFATEKRTNGHLTVTANNDGFDIYSPANILFNGVGYRYGPTIIKNADGSRDIFLAAPGSQGEWDWITYRHFDKNMKNTNGEIAVLQPTPGSDDFYSTCDPGAVYFGGYYYIGYTSTTNPVGQNNNVFVARSKNVDGPYEKWNGSGWGGNPQMIEEYTDEEDCFGVGEPSLVVVGDKLYMYYTYASPCGDVRLAVADATDENWPATLTEMGNAFTDAADGTDSVDVKYIDKYNKFIAICTAQRMSENSRIEIYESDDGINFTLCSVLKTNIAWYCHNAGIEANPSGHIENPDSVMIGYAYGKKWGAWSLRLQTVKISLTNEIDLSDNNNPNVKQQNKFDPFFFRFDFTGITTAKRVYDVSLSGGSFRVKFLLANRYTLCFPLFGNVNIYGYDENIIKVNGKKITPLKKGSTLAYAEWNGRRTAFLIKVN